MEEERSLLMTLCLLISSPTCDVVLPFQQVPGAARFDGNQAAGCELLKCNNKYIMTGNIPMETEKESEVL